MIPKYFKTLLLAGLSFSSTCVFAIINETPIELTALQKTATEEAIKLAYKTAYDRGFKSYLVDALATSISLLETDPNKPAELYYSSLIRDSTITADSNVKIESTPKNGLNFQKLVARPGFFYSVTAAADGTRVAGSSGNRFYLINPIASSTELKLEKIVKAGVADQTFAGMATQNKSNVFLINISSRNLESYNCQTTPFNQTQTALAEGLASSTLLDNFAHRQVVAAGSDGTLWYLKTNNEITRRLPDGSTSTVNFPTKTAAATIVGIAAAGTAENHYLIVLDSEQKVHINHTQTTTSRWFFGQFAEVNQVAIGAHGTAAIRMRVDLKETGFIGQGYTDPVSKKVYAVGGMILVADAATWQKPEYMTLQAPAAAAPQTTERPAPSDEFAAELAKITNAFDSINAVEKTVELVEIHKANLVNLTAIVEKLQERYSKSNQFGKESILTNFVIPQNTLLTSLKNSEKAQQLVWDGVLNQLIKTAKINDLIAEANQILSQTTEKAKMGQLVDLIANKYQNSSKASDKGLILNDLINLNKARIETTLADPKHRNWQMLLAGLEEQEVLNVFSGLQQIQLTSLTQLKDFLNQAFARASGQTGPFVDDNLKIVSNKTNNLVIQPGLKANTALRQKLNAAVIDNFNDEFINNVYALSKGSDHVMDALLDTMGILSDLLTGNALELLEEISQPNAAQENLTEALTKIVKNIDNYDDPHSTKIRLYQKLLDLAEVDEDLEGVTKLIKNTDSPMIIKISGLMIPGYILKNTKKWTSRGQMVIYGNSNNKLQQTPLTFAALDAIKKNLVASHLQEILINLSRTSSAEIADGELDKLLNLPYQADEIKRLFTSQGSVSDVDKLTSRITEISTGTKAFYTDKDKVKQVQEILGKLTMSGVAQPSIYNNIFKSTTSSTVKSPSTEIKTEIKAETFIEKAQRLLNPKLQNESVGLIDYLNNNYAEAGKPDSELIKKFVQDLNSITLHPINKFELSAELKENPDLQQSLINSLKLLFQGRGVPALNNETQKANKIEIMRILFTLIFPLGQFITTLENNQRSTKADSESLSAGLETIVKEDFFNPDTAGIIFKTSDLTMLQKLSNLIKASWAPETGYYQKTQTLEQAQEKVDQIIAKLAPTTAAAASTTAPPAAVGSSSSSSGTPAAAAGQSNEELLSNALKTLSPSLEALDPINTEIATIAASTKAAKKAKDKDLVKALAAARKITLKQGSTIERTLAQNFKALPENQKTLVINHFDQNSATPAGKAFKAFHNKLKAATAAPATASPAAAPPATPAA